VLRVLLDRLNSFLNCGLGGFLRCGLGGWHIAPLDEHKQSREHEAASEAETEAEPERKGERIASVANVVVGGLEWWR
jgi:hypothetical protein